MKSKWHLILKPLLVILCLIVFFKKAESQSIIDSPSSPNIVLIVADDLGYGDVGAYGAEKIQTPNIDSLAASGVRFTDAHTSSALCSPSRYSIMTGRYPWRTRLKSGVLAPYSEPLIEPERLTIASLLKHRGYYTAGVGKWHLGYNWPLKPGKELSQKKKWSYSEEKKIDYSGTLSGGPNALGFDEYYGIPGSNNMFPYVIIENRHVTQAPSVPKTPYDTDWEHALRAPNWSTKLMGAKMTEKAVSIIRNHFSQKNNQPFFLYFPTTSIHRPAIPNQTKGQSNAGMRGDLVAEFDWTVGEIVQALKDQGEFNNTLFIITSDNGARPGDPMDWIRRLQSRSDAEDILPNDYLSGEYQPEMPYHKPNYGGPWMMYGHDPTGKYLGFKDDPWEGGHRVPFIVHWGDKIKNPRLSNQTLCLTDLIATFADLTNQELPDNAGEDSYNMLPAILGNSKRNIPKDMINVSGAGEFTIRKEKWKLIDIDSLSGADTHYPSKIGIGPELYNLEKDPGEQHNVFPDHPQIVKEMRQLLRKAKEQGHTAPRLEKNKAIPK